MQGKENYYNMINNEPAVVIVTTLDTDSNAPKNGQNQPLLSSSPTLTAASLSTHRRLHQAAYAMGPHIKTTGGRAVHALAPPLRTVRRTLGKTLTKTRTIAFRAVRSLVASDHRQTIDRKAIKAASFFGLTTLAPISVPATLVAVSTSVLASTIANKSRNSTQSSAPVSPPNTPHNASRSFSTAQPSTVEPMDFFSLNQYADNSTISDRDTGTGNSGADAGANPDASADNSGAGNNGADADTNPDASTDNSGAGNNGADADTNPDTGADNSGAGNSGANADVTINMETQEITRPEVTDTAVTMSF